MKKNKSMYIIIIALVIVFSTFSNICLAELGNGFNEDALKIQGSTSTIEQPVKKIWSTVLLIMQILAILGVIVMGIRYMIASPSQKASMKGTTIYAIIGIVMVFAVFTVIRYFTNIVEVVL